MSIGDPQVRTVCLGTVYEAQGNRAGMNLLQLDRAGRLTWRRGR